jgi:hypothetical protein
MHFGTKSYLKSTRNHTAKHALSGARAKPWFVLINKIFFNTWLRQNTYRVMKTSNLYFSFLFGIVFPLVFECVLEFHLP